MTRTHHFEAEVSRCLTKIEKNAKIIDIQAHQGNSNFTVKTQVNTKDQVTFSNVGRAALLDALKKQGVLDAHAPLVFGQDLKAYLENGFEILMLYRTMVITALIG
jgi:hypothetical protein